MKCRDQTLEGGSVWRVKKQGWGGWDGVRVKEVAGVCASALILMCTSEKGPQEVKSPLRDAEEAPPRSEANMNCPPEV